MSGHLYLILNAGQRTKLGLHHHAVIVGILHHTLGDLDVLGEGLGGCVDHHRGKAAVDAALAGLEVGTVVQMQHDGDIGAALHSGLHQLHQISVVGIGTGALADLKDHGGVLLLAGLGDALYDLHVVDVESADGVAAVIGLFKHFLGSDQWHKNRSFSKIVLDLYGMIGIIYPWFIVSHFFFFATPSHLLYGISVLN